MAKNAKNSNFLQNFQKKLTFYVDKNKKMSYNGKVENLKRA